MKTQNRHEVDINYLDNVLDSTIEAVEKGQNEIFNIFEYAKQECEQLKKNIEKVKREVSEMIDNVEILEKSDRKSKLNLMMVSKNFNKYSENDIKSAYEKAKDIQVKLKVAQHMEKQLRAKRNGLERAYKGMSVILRRAEHLSVQLGVALSFLQGNIEDISTHLSDANQKQSFAAEIIKAQEEERKRVARDIHDGPAQTMANVIIQAEICEKLFEIDIKNAKLELDGLKQIVRGSLNELRKIIFNLRPAALDDLGLVAVLRRYCADFERETGINTKFSIFGDKMKLNPNIEVTLFRIIQEALNNIKKHSKALNAHVKLECMNSLVNLTITDDGCGFKWNSESHGFVKEHFGLMSIKERADLFDGLTKIESTPQKGTKIFVSVPLK